MADIETIECLVCGCSKAFVTNDPKYNGLRGNCSKCDNNWPES